MFAPSPQQSTFFDFLLHDTRNCCLSACAGSGKTTTVFEGMKYLPQVAENSFLPPSVVYIAFNKDIVAAAKAKAPRNCQVLTGHALGRRSLVASGRYEPAVVRARDFARGNKNTKRLYNILGEIPDMRDVIRLLSLARTQPRHWADMDDAYFRAHMEKSSLQIEEPQAAFAAVRKTIATGAEDYSCIDFDEMLYLPIVWNLPFEPQDYVFVDEAQDTNDIQLEMFTRLAKPAPSSLTLMNDYAVGLDRRPSPTRFFFVGDPHQAIYGFRGANSDSMARIAARFSCVELPLSVSFRCPQLVVAEAQKFLRPPLKLSGNMITIQSEPENFA